MTRMIGRLLCKIGFHRDSKVPVIANLDTYWMQGGAICVRCDRLRVSFGEASRLITSAYERGKQNSATQFLAYGRGVEKVVALYGKAYVQKMLDRDGGPEQ
jgi:hypothetical protein